MERKQAVVSAPSAPRDKISVADAIRKPFVPVSDKINYLPAIKCVTSKKASHHQTACLSAAVKILKKS